MPSLTNRKRRLAGFRSVGESYVNLDLRSALAFGSSWSKGKMVNCRLDGASFRQATFEDFTFENCTGLLVDFSIGKWTNVGAKFCGFTQSAFGGTVFRDVAFDQCELDYSVFADAMGQNLKMDGCSCHGADLRFQDMTGFDPRGSNLWSAHVQLGCQFFQGSFDERQARLFLAMVARRYPDADIASRLKELCGKEYDVVERLMRES